ncbi:MAG: hypothetical protein KKA65_01845 [Nanoarchaeota archaeon]|nr:hypothetical protein [Nanoarchaeota archaeon]MCG2720213.1 hypothetical protein [Nanoarchaeota archaeon]
MKKTTKIFIFLIFLLINSLLVTAKLSCEIVDKVTYAPDNCGTNGALIFKLSDIGEGGHLGDVATSNFNYHLCCYGIPGIASTTTSTNNKYLISLSSPTSDAHVAIQEGTSFIDYYLSSPTAVTCAYSLADCAGFDTCLLSTQDDTPIDAHVSDCNTGYTKKLCCTAGADVCAVTGVYWGIVEGDQVNLVDTIGMRQMALMIVQAENCENHLVDYTIKKSGATFNSTIKDVPFGVVPDYFGGGDLPGFAIGLWWSTDGLPVGPYDEPFTFTAVLRNPGFGTVQSPESDILTVNSQCIALNPYDYVGECDFTEASLDATLGPPACINSKTDCDGIIGCIDEDCDQIDDCLDEYIFTSSESDICTGAPIGTAGCVPSMDCTGLLWSDCYECKSGEFCDTLGGFKNEFVMERCQGLDQVSCKCEWIGAKPESCSDSLLNQWNNRFKGCIMEEEFPIFDNWNFLIVVLLLISYYAVIIYKKKK